MEYLNLGQTGLRVSRLCLGMMSFGKHESREWALDEVAAEPIVRRAVEGGVIFFDTADVYNGGQSEVVTGSLLKKLFGMREEYVVATKVHGRTMPGENGRGLSRKHILASIEASLERLELDYVDLYQIHRWDPLTPIEETMEALHAVVRAGKARYIGASSMWAWQFAKAQLVAPTRFVSMQNHYNLVYREEEREMIPQCIDQGVAVVPWSPLARGLLAGTRTREGERLTTRAQSDPFGDSLYTAHNARADRPIRGKASTCPRSTSPSSTASRRSPRSAASPWRRSRLPGCCTSLVSQRLSSARRKPSTSTTRLPPKSSRLATRRSHGSKSRTSRTRFRASRSSSRSHD